MLLALDIKDFAIIKDVSLEFTDGFTALIGETGAGKSILIDALAILLGQRASSELIRAGSKKAVISGQFSLASKTDQEIISLLEENSIPVADETLLIVREITSNGRNTVRINGQLTTNNLLVKIGKKLVDIHGQTDHQILMDEEQHITLLDQFGKAAFQQKLAAYRLDYQAYQKLVQQLARLTKDTQLLAQKKDILAFQVDEIQQAEITSVTEDVDLEQEYQKLSNFQRISDGALRIQEILENSELNVVDLVAEAMTTAQELEKYSNDYQGLSQTLQDAYFALDESRTGVNDVIDELDFDEERYQFLIERLDLLGKLKKKYGPTLGEVLEFLDKSQAELLLLSDGEQNFSTLRAEIATLEEKLTAAAAVIHQERRAIAQKLTAKIKQELQQLYMDKAVFKIEITATRDFYANGMDQVRFLIAPNPGEELKPLVKIASGGEQSRIVLALKVIFGQSTSVETMIFDEIDTGVSGRVASAIGAKMRELAKKKQVLTITHSPQVAALATQRYLIVKEVRDNRTYSSVQELDLEKSVEAIARMLSGNELSQASLDNARELLKK